MADQEAVALYGTLKTMAEAMAARDAVLDAKTVALSQAVADLQQLPGTLGKQTSQYIAMGVRQSIQDDFSRPINEAVKGPIRDLTQATYHARIAMDQVGKESRIQGWRWIAVVMLLGIAIGGSIGYYFFVQDLNRISDRLDTLQQQIAPAVPAAEAKPGDAQVPRRKGR